MNENGTIWTTTRHSIHITTQPTIQDGESNLTAIHKTDSAVFYLKLVSYPILAFVMVCSLFMILVVSTRKTVRAFSATIYLIAVICGDLLWVIGRYGLSYVVTMNPELQLNAMICTVIAGIFFVGEIYPGFLIVILAMERCFMLNIPSQFAGAATPKSAILICMMLLVLCAGLSGYFMHDSQWDTHVRQCVRGDLEVGEGIVPPQTRFRIFIIGFLIISQITLSTMITVFVRRKRRNRSQDPIHNAIANARRHSNQLNRINLIACLLVLHYTIASIIKFVSDALFWPLVAWGGGDVASLVVTILELVGFLFTATRAYIIAAVSAKFRKEFFRGLQCRAHSNSTQNIIKKMKVHYKSDPRGGRVHIHQVEPSSNGVIELE